MSATPSREGPTIAVVGNCQARPLAQIIKTMRPDVALVEPVIVHLAKPEEEAAVMERLSGADIVLAQIVADTYPVPYVRNGVQREAFGDKLFLWLNLYYRGQNPELTYIRKLPNRHRRYPLSDYHITTIAEAYKAGLSVDATVERLADPDYNRATYEGVAAASLDELRRREDGLPVKIVDDIAEREASERLFFTFNHPSVALLAEYAGRILTALGLPPRLAIAPGMMNEPLSPVVVPPNPIAPFAARTAGQPRTYRAVPHPDEKVPGPFLLTEEDVVARYFAAYDEHARGIL